MQKNKRNSFAMHAIRVPLYKKCFICIFNNNKHRLEHSKAKADTLKLNKVS